VLHCPSSSSWARSAGWPSQWLSETYLGWRTLDSMGLLRLLPYFEEEHALHWASWLTLLGLTSRRTSLKHWSSCRLWTGWGSWCRGQRHCLRRASCRWADSSPAGGPLWLWNCSSSAVRVVSKVQFQSAPMWCRATSGIEKCPRNNWKNHDYCKD